MALPKAVFNREVPTQNLVTTITGIITIVLTILVSFGVITPAENTELNTHLGTILNAGVAVWGAVSGIILIFKAQDA